jgi:hypothetical protein
MALTQKFTAIGPRKSAKRAGGFTPELPPRKQAKGILGAALAAKGSTLTGTGSSATVAKPPAGTYDPTLDANYAAAQRGYGDTTQDTEKAGQRASSQYELDKQSVNLGAGRSLSDLLAARVQAHQDNAKAVADTSRNYGILGDTQSQQAGAAGVLSGGTLRAALAKRTENESRDQASLKAAIDRFDTASGTSESRLNEDTSRQLASLGLDYGYGVNDRQDALDRAGRELGFFGADTDAQRLYQAIQNGYVPPAVAKAAKSKLAAKVKAEAPKLVKQSAQPTSKTKTKKAGKK